MRGIETRRHDTPAIVSSTQLEILQMLASVPSAGSLSDVLPRIRRLLKERIRAVREQRLPLHEFVVRQTLSRTSDEYRGSSSVATAIRQLEEVGKSLRPGQTVRFVYTLGHTRVRAWDLPTLPDVRSLDTHRYIELLLRAAETALTQLGFSRKDLDEWVFDSVRSMPLWPNEFSLNAERPIFASDPSSVRFSIFSPKTQKPLHNM